MPGGGAIERRNGDEDLENTSPSGVFQTTSPSRPHLQGVRVTTVTIITSILAGKSLSRSSR